jgi:hypothetical protein
MAESLLFDELLSRWWGFGASFGRISYLFEPKAQSSSVALDEDLDGGAEALFGVRA